MNVIRKSKFISSILAFLILFAGCSVSDSSRSVKVLDADEAFKATFFGVGKYATQIPETEIASFILSNLSEDHQEDYLRFVDILTLEYQSLNPKQFQDFEAAVASGDINLIESAVLNNVSQFASFYKGYLEEHSNGLLTFSELKEQDIISDIEITHFQKAIENRDSDGVKSFLATLESRVEKSLSPEERRQDETRAKTIGFTVACVYSVAGAITIGVAITTAAVVGVYVAIASEWAFGEEENLRFDDNKYLEGVIVSLSGL